MAARAVLAHIARDFIGKNHVHHQYHHLPHRAALLGAGGDFTREPDAAETVDGGDSIDGSYCFLCVECVGSDTSSDLVLAVDLAGYASAWAVKRASE